MSIPKKVREALKDRAFRSCEVCGRYGATNAHHRKNRSQGGQDVLSNLMLLCGSGTTLCHGLITGSPRWAAEQGYTVWSHEDPDSKPVYIRGLLSLLCDDGSVVAVPEGGVA